LLPNLVEAYDDMKEELLVSKSYLYAKKQVIAKEMSKDRFAEAAYGRVTLDLKREMHNYVKAIG